jgi:hypothetical protein
MPFSSHFSKPFIAAVVVVFFAAIASSPGQDYKYPYGTEAGAGVLDLAKARMPEDRSPEAIRAVLNPLDGTNVTKLVFYISGYKSFLQAVENARNDVQTGSSSSSSGTTSVVSKGVAAQVLSLATENGAVSRVDSKTVSTFRLNPLGVGRLLKGDDVFPYCAIYDSQCESLTARALSGLSASVSFNTTPGSSSLTTTPTTSSDNSRVLTASSQQISGWGARYDFHVKKKSSELAKNYKAQFNETVGKTAAAYGKSVNQFVTDLMTKIPSDDLTAWQNRYVDRLRSPEAADQGGLTKVLSDAVRDLAALAEKADPQIKQASDLVVANMSSYFVSRDKLMNDYVNKMTFSISYDDAYPANQPHQSSAKFILSAKPSFAQVTANGTVEWYDQLLKSNVSRLRDAQFAIQFDHTYGTVNSQISPTLSAGYYYQYMVDNGLLTLPSTALAPGTTIALPGNASELLNTKGSVHVGQAKVTFKIKNSGVTIPLALTFSNRTDLIKASSVHGNFGLSYDLDSLFTRH